MSDSLWTAQQGWASQEWEPQRYGAWEIASKGMDPCSVILHHLNAQHWLTAITLPTLQIRFRAIDTPYITESGMGHHLSHCDPICTMQFATENIPSFGFLILLRPWHCHKDLINTPAHQLAYCTSLHFRRGTEIWENNKLRPWFKFSRHAFSAPVSRR